MARRRIDKTGFFRPIDKGFVLGEKICAGRAEKDQRPSRFSNVHFELLLKLSRNVRRLIVVPSLHRKAAIQVCEFRTGFGTGIECSGSGEKDVETSDAPLLGAHASTRNPPVVFVHDAIADPQP